MKRSNLRPKLLHGVYGNYCTAYRLVTNLVIWRELWPTFPGSKVFPQRIYRTPFVRERRNLATLGVWPIESYFANFVNFAPGSRDTMRRHASVIHWCTCKVLFDNFPMFDELLVFFLFTVLPEDSVQAFCTSALHRAMYHRAMQGTWFPATRVVKLPVIYVGGKLPVTYR